MNAILVASWHHAGKGLKDGLWVNYNDYSEAPYDGRPMKKVFELTVPTFKLLSDWIRESHISEILILKILARIRLYLVILDFDFEELVIEIFKYFLKFIRLQRKNVLSYVDEIIITLLQDSDNLPIELLSLLWHNLWRDKENVSPNAHELVKRVLESYSTNPDASLIQVIKSSGIPCKIIVI